VERALYTSPPHTWSSARTWQHSKPCCDLSSEMGRAPAQHKESSQRVVWVTAQSRLDSVVPWLTRSHVHPTPVKPHKYNRKIHTVPPLSTFRQQGLRPHCSVTEPRVQPGVRPGVNLHWSKVPLSKRQTDSEWQEQERKTVSKVTSVGGVAQTSPVTQRLPTKQVGHSKQLCLVVRPCV
jgi:hypothetical protein